MPNHDETGDLTNVNATREDIHRLRNEVQRLVGDISVRVLAVDHTVTRLETLASNGLTAIQIAQILAFVDTVKELKNDVEGMKKLIYRAVGAVGVLAPLATVLIQRAIGGT